MVVPSRATVSRMAHEKPEAKQRTPKGHEIPVPKRKDVFDFLKGVTGRAPSAGEDRGAKKQ